MCYILNNRYFFSINLDFGENDIGLPEGHADVTGAKKNVLKE